MCKASNVETCRIARVLGESNILSVNPKIEERIHSVEFHVEFLTFPCLRNGERTTIRAYLVAIFIGCPIVGRFAHHAFAPIVFLHLVEENHGLVDVDGRSVFLTSVFLQADNVPIGRNDDVVPSRTIEICLIEVFWSFVGILGEMEFPCSVERLPSRTIFRQYLTCFFFRSKGSEIRTWLQFVVSQEHGRLPFLTRRCCI